MHEWRRIKAKTRKHARLTAHHAALHADKHIMQALHAIEHIMQALHADEHIMQALHAD
jgi:hypothetical protein